MLSTPQAQCVRNTAASASLISLLTGGLQCSEQAKKRLGLQAIYVHCRRINVQWDIYKIFALLPFLFVPVRDLQAPKLLAQKQQ